MFGGRSALRKCCVALVAALFQLWLSLGFIYDKAERLGVFGLSRVKHKKHILAPVDMRSSPPWIVVLDKTFSNLSSE